MAGRSVVLSWTKVEWGNKCHYRVQWQEVDVREMEWVHGSNSSNVGPWCQAHRWEIVVVEVNISR